MANSNTDLIRDHFVDAVYECYRKGYMTDQEYGLMMDDFTYHFDQIINVVEERKIITDQNDDPNDQKALTEFEDMGGEFYAI